MSTKHLSHPARTLVALASLLATGAACAQVPASLAVPRDLRFTAPPAGLAGRVERLPETGPAPASLTSRANVSGSLTQNQAGGAQIAQTFAIGSIQAGGAAGRLEAEGQVSGALQQNASGAATTGGQQLITVGGLSGRLGGGELRSVGNSSAAITQSAGAGSAASDQQVDIAGISDSSANNLLARGTVTGPGITQSTARESNQRILVGSVRDSTLQQAETEGIVNASVQQTVSGGGGGTGQTQQTLSVAAIDASQAQTITTQGSLGASVVQSSGGGIAQTIAIGSVGDVETAGSIATRAAAAGGSLQQVGTGSDGGTQQIRIGSVDRGAPAIASTQASFTGTATQAVNAPGLSNTQVVGIGAIVGSQGQASTNASFSGNLTQAVGPALGGNSMAVHVGSAIATTGIASTRASVSGGVTQTGTSSGRPQAILVGAAIATAGNVTTDAVVTGNLAQSSSGGSGSSQSQQTMLIGTTAGR